MTAPAVIIAAVFESSFNLKTEFLLYLACVVYSFKEEFSLSISPEKTRQLTINNSNSVRILEECTSSLNSDGIKGFSSSQAVVAYVFKPSTRGKQVNLCELETSLIWRASLRTARDTQRDHV